MKNIITLKLEGNWKSFEQNLISKTILDKVFEYSIKTNKIRKDEKTLISVFWKF